VRAGFDPAKALALIERRVVLLNMSLGDDVAAIRALCQRYDIVPASLTDAFLIWLAGVMELLIAAHSMAKDSAIITNNAREFLRVPGLALEEWAD
jgi:predicted nucleic acid-binding protein